MGERIWLTKAPSGQIITNRLKSGDWSFSIRYQVEGDRHQEHVCRTSDKAEGLARAQEALDQMRAAWNSMSLKEAEREVYKLTLSDRLAAWMKAQNVTSDQVRAALRQFDRRAK